MCNLAVDKVFSLLDADKSGNLSSEEIAEHCKSVDCKDFIAVESFRKYFLIKFKNWPKQKQKSMILNFFLLSADKDGDGEVSKAEFKLAVASNPKFLCVLFSVI